MSQKQHRRSFLGAVAAVIALGKNVTFVDGGFRRQANLYRIWSDRLDMMLDGSAEEYLKVEFGDNQACFQICGPRTRLPAIFHLSVVWMWDANEEDRDVLKTVIRNRLRQWHGLPPLSPEEPRSDLCNELLSKSNPPSFPVRVLVLKGLRV